MGTISNKLSKNRYLLYLLIISTLMFVILYNKMIFHGYIYAYYDIGRDTLATYIPRYFFDSDWIRQGKTSQYCLQNGLGVYTYNPVYKYIFPYNFLLMFCNNSNLNIVLLVSLFIKIMIICSVSYLYFKGITGNEKAAFVAGLVWTFSSYMVVWGQHYQFASLVLEFTVGIYVLQRYLEDKTGGALLVIPLVLMVWDSYFHLYMNGIFFAIYTVVWLFVNKRNIKIYLKKLAGLIIMAVVACGIAMIQLLPALQSFFASTRTEDVSVSDQGLELFYSKKYLITFIGRFLSANMLGVGNGYTGAYNYYEAALLSCSVIVVFSIIFLFYGKYVKRVIGLGILVVVSLISPVVSQLIGMNDKKQRWSYMIIYIFCISVAFFVKGILEFEDRQTLHKILKRTVLVSDVIGVVALTVLLIVQKLTEITVCKRALLCCVAFFVIYSVLLLSIGQKKQKYMSGLFAGILILELILSNYASINSRYILQEKQWDETYFNDGTTEAVTQLKELDSGIYRVNKTYISVGENDALVQGYNGLAVYNSLNTSELINFYKSAGYELINGFSHWLSVPVYDYYINCLLGTKYVITLPDEDLSTPEYKLLLETEYKKIYENQYALPFGYLYSDRVYSSDIDSLERVNRQKLLTKYFYITEENQKYGNEIKATHVDTEAVTNIEHTAVLENIQSLQKTGMTDISFEDSILCGKVTNDDTDTKMLVIPIIFNKNWKAYVDGEAVDVYNVNGGILGVNITQGIHEIKLMYSAPNEKLAKGISIGMLSIYVVYEVMMLMKKKWKRRYKQNENSCICTNKIK
mgnify:FL=1